MSDRNKPHRDGRLFPIPVAGAMEIFGGHIIAANAGGYAVPATATAAQITIGVSDGWLDNRTGGNGSVDAAVDGDSAVALATARERITTLEADARTRVEQMSLLNERLDALAGECHALKESNAALTAERDAIQAQLAATDTAKGKK